MRDYLIATSSTAALPRPWLEEHHIPFISYSYTVGDKLCRDDCRGLCPRCGANLNDGPCSCEPEADPRFAALQRLLNDNK